VDFEQWEAEVMTGPLDGLKVVEVGVAMAAPYCAMVLGDMGAEVVKVERVGTGDDSRAWPPHLDGKMGHYFASANRGKRSIAVDLKAPEGVEIVRKLAAEADVFVENFRVGALEAAGLGYKALSELNPRLVYCSISGFGRTGPRAEERANDLFMQAFSGSMSVTGEVGGGPVKIGLSVADIGAGLFATIGVMAALEARHTTGRGQHVDTSLLAGQLAMLSYHLPFMQATGQVPGPQGSGSSFGVPYQAFPTADDWLVIAVFNDTMWESLCEAIEKPEWIGHPEMVDVTTRVANRDEVIALLTEVLVTKGADHWSELLGARGIPCTRVNRLDQILADPQVVENGMIEDVDVPGIGPVRLAAPAVQFSDPADRRPTPLPWLGEHTREVLAELGYADPDIDHLATTNVVGLVSPV
jgi:crotonobetainyl-CoA:carnitine CoA-transferase CaiB-like acyl-CoA transferase